nr:reverse transcriptase domain-containing protein [Tanacetum cinerariifolium]
LKVAAATLCAVKVADDMIVVSGSGNVQVREIRYFADSTCSYFMLKGRVKETLLLHQSMDELHGGKINVTLQWYHRTTGFKAIQAVPSTVREMLKFSVDGGITTICSTILIPAECASVITSPVIPEEEKSRHANFTVALHPDFPDQEVVIGGSLSDKGRTALCSVLKKNLDIFAWHPSDMTGVPRSVAEHRLNIREGYSPVRQKKMVQAPERAKAIQAEVQKLVDARIMREVYYHDWLSNPVMVKKHAGSWRMCVDFTNLNKAYAYKGYHQIQLAEVDEEKTAFHTGQGVYCYTKMPFGLKNAGATYQRLIDKAFESQVRWNIEVYVDDLVVKSYTEAEMVRDIEETFHTLHKVNIKLNPKKCPFGLAEGVFLGEKTPTVFSGTSYHGDVSQAAPTEVTQEEPWTLFTDGSSCVDGSGVGHILTNPEGVEFTYALRPLSGRAGEGQVPDSCHGLLHEVDRSKGSSNNYRRTGEEICMGQYCMPLRYPRLVERVNRSLGEGIKARLGERNKNWVEELPHVLWAHRIMIKSSHDDTPFSLTYITEAVIPIEIGMPTYRTAAVDVVNNDEESRLKLDLLEERRERAVVCEARAKSKMMKYYNARVRDVAFKPGDFVYRSNDASHAVAGGKLGPKWEGPYEVTKALGNGAYKLRSTDGTVLPRMWNVINLKRCYL